MGMAILWGEGVPLPSHDHYDTQNDRQQWVILKYDPGKKMKSWQSDRPCVTQCWQPSAAK